MQPFIGVTSSVDAEGRPVVRDTYVRALHAAGARPVPLPFVDSEAAAQELLEQLDGLVFTGSDDLDPRLWNEEPHEQTVLQGQIAAADRHIDRLVYELYELTAEEIRIVEEGMAKACPPEH